MVIFSLFSWWYTKGWLTLVRAGGERIKGVLNFFSVPLLASSLFAPFRQISAGRPTGGSLSAQLQAFGDRLFSRFMGAIIRSFLIILGVATVIVATVVVGIVLLLWPLIPLAPVVSMVVVGVYPW
jgi:hypothetical protein